MKRSFQVHGLMALSAFSLAVVTAGPAQATIIVNGSFENKGTATNSFSISNPTVLPGWAATPSGNKVLDCLVVAGETDKLCGTPNGWTLQFWNNGVGGPFAGGLSPDGGNYVAIDGSTDFATPLTQTLTGLVVGQSYDISFYQAATQQFGPNFNGATTERWNVSLGSQSQLSTLMNTPNHGYVGWMQQTLSFTAQNVSDTLTFLAVGTPSGVPPFVLLDGVSIKETPPSSTPEPGTWAMLGVGGTLLAVGSKRRGAAPVK